MDYKKIEKGNGKLIDELPQSKSKLTRRRKANGAQPVKKGIHLSMVQVMAPVLIAVVGIAVIHLMPDKLTPTSPPVDAKVSIAQAPQPQTGARFDPSTGSTNARRLDPSAKSHLGRASLAPADKVKIGTGKKSENRAAPDAVSRDAGEKHVSLVSAVVCEGVQDHQPKAEKDAFTMAGSRRVYVWMEVLSKSQPFIVKHHYYLNGQEHSEVPLQIKYPRMRTWSYVTIDKPEHIGIWRVDIVCNDSILKTVEFRVSDGAA